MDTNAHWVIQAAHLAGGIGALAFIGIIGTHYQPLKQAADKRTAISSLLQKSLSENRTAMAAYGLQIMEEATRLGTGR